MADPEERPRAKIRWLRVEEYRGLEHLELTLVDPRERTSSLLVLAGPNGSGKTRALEACLIALGRFDLLRRPLVRREGRTPRRPFRRELLPLYERARITAEIEFDSESRKVELAGKQIVEGLVGPRLRPSSSFQATYFSSWRGPRLPGPVSIEIRREPRPVARDEDRLTLIKQYLVNAKAHGQMVLGLRERMPTSTISTGSLYEVLIERLNTAWSQFRPGRRERFAVEPVSDDPGEGFDVFLQSENRTRIALDALSSGELEIFTFLGWMLTAHEDTDVVVIDEPELHLDPQWHALVLRAFQQILPRSQFLVSTHSPRLYQSVFEFQRHLLVPEGDPRARAWTLDNPPSPPPERSAERVQ